VSSLQGRDTDVLVVGQSPTARSILPSIAALADVAPCIPIVLWVSYIGEVDIFRALRMGARGVMRRTDPIPVILACLRAVAGGETWLGSSVPGFSRAASAAARLTSREREVIELVCRGLSNREIAQALSIAPGTVKVHLTHIFEKTGLRDRFLLAEHGSKFLCPAPGSGQNG
jgi:DNA-binding NarL/FixJ family response regulator